MSLKILTGLALGTLLLLAGCAARNDSSSGGGTPSPPKEALELVPLVSHIQFGVFEQDVYIERTGSPGKVFRVTPANATNAATKDAPLFATAATTAHDPTFANVGPFDRGAALNVKASDWLAATGSVAYLCTGGTVARVDGVFSHLVPNAVYTFWNSRLDFTNGAITGATDLAIGTSDGSQNRFNTDDKGNAHFALTWTGCDEPATGGPGIGPTGSARVFALAYHSDGQTYGSAPGPFGQKTHVQLFGFVKAAPAA